MLGTDSTFLRFSRFNLQFVWAKFSTIKGFYFSLDQKQTFLHVQKLRSRLQAATGPIFITILKILHSTIEFSEMRIMFFEKKKLKLMLIYHVKALAVSVLKQYQHFKWYFGQMPLVFQININLNSFWNSFRNQSSKWNDQDLHEAQDNPFIFNIMVRIWPFLSQLSDTKLNF